MPLDVSLPRTGGQLCVHRLDDRVALRSSQEIKRLTNLWLRHVHAPLGAALA